MATKKKTGKKKTTARAAAKTKAAPAARAKGGAKAGAAELDPVRAALQRRRLALLSR